MSKKTKFYIYVLLNDTIQLAANYITIDTFSKTAWLHFQASYMALYYINTKENICY